MGKQYFCSYSILGFKAAVEAWSESADLDGLVGASCSIVCQPVGLLAAYWNIPMVSFFCASGSLADKETYPTFTRTAPNILALFPRAFAATIDAFGSVSTLSIYIHTCQVTRGISESPVIFNGVPEIFQVT